jgi:hypothetical protein
MARGARDVFEMDGTKSITITKPAPNGIAISATTAQRLIIGAGCTTVGGYFGPLLKRVRVLDLRAARANLKIGPRTFAGFRFKEVSVPGFATKPFEFCAAFREAFDVFGSPWGVTFTPGDDWKKALGTVRKSEVLGLRGAVPWTGFDWRDFPNLLDLSGVNWVELPKVPDAVKGTLALRSLPRGLQSIPDFAFDGSRALALTVLPEGVVSIGRFAFRGCTALGLTDLPKGLRSIEEGAFEGCKSLALSTWPEGIKNDGRCGVMVVGGAVELVRKAKLDVFVEAGAGEEKEYVFAVSNGTARVESGPVRVVRTTSGPSETRVTLACVEEEP